MAILDEGKEMCRIRKRRRKKWEITAEIRQCVFWYEHVYFCWWRDANGKKKWTRFVFFSPLTLFPPLNVSVHLSVPSCQVRRCWQSTACLSVHLSVRPPVCQQAPPPPSLPSSHIQPLITDEWVLLQWKKKVLVDYDHFDISNFASMAEDEAVDTHLKLSSIRPSSPQHCSPANPGGSRGFLSPHNKQYIIPPACSGLLPFEHVFKRVQYI